MAKECRQLGLVTPSSPSYDAAYLGSAYAVLLGQANASPSSELRSPQADGVYLRCRQLCRAALFAILHGAVLTHIHLVIRVGGPTQVILVIVPWVTVSVRYVRQLFWVRYERQRDQPVHRSGMSLSAPRQVQHNSLVPAAHLALAQQATRLQAVLTTVYRYPVTAYLAFLRNFVVRKTFNLFPHGGLQ